VFVAASVEDFAGGGVIEHAEDADADEDDAGGLEVMAFLSFVEFDESGYEVFEGDEGEGVRN
jgi:hypothetical protein